MNQIHSPNSECCKALFLEYTGEFYWVSLWGYLSITAHWCGTPALACVVLVLLEPKTFSEQRLLRSAFSWEHRWVLLRVSLGLPFHYSPLLWITCSGLGMLSLPQKPLPLLKHTWSLALVTQGKPCLKNNKCKSSSPARSAAYLAFALSLPAPLLTYLWSRSARLPWEQVFNPELRHQYHPLPGTLTSCEMFPQTPFC